MMISKRIAEARVKVFFWLFPEVLGEINRLRWITEAMHDIHATGAPYAALDMAFENVRNLEPDLMSGKMTIEDRQKSLIEICRRIWK